MVEWNEVPQEHRNGEIQGYRVLYSDSHGLEQDKTVHTSTRQTSVTDLKKSTVYTIKVLAFTSAGDGPESPAIHVSTAEDSKWEFRYKALGWPRQRAAKERYIQVKGANL